MKLVKIIWSIVMCLRLLCFFGLLAGISSSLPALAETSEWVMPIHEGDQLRWGIKGGLQFGIFPGSLSGNGTGGPRGLMRIWYPAMPGGKYCLVNFIAIEPEVNGRAKGFSELERSELDHTTGKRITAPETAILRTLPSGETELGVTYRVEPFNNGAHIMLLVTQRSNQPDEVHFHIRTEADSVPLKRCVLTATWGNLTRSRQIWLRDGTANSLDLYRDYCGNQFAADTRFPLETLARLPQGEVLVAMTSNEADISSVHPLKDSNHFYYGGCPITQYWKKTHIGPDSDLSVRVNGRFMYWKSQLPVPGGITFENFEMRERFYEGQEFIFGVTARKPEELGFKHTKEN